ncbi:DUF1207 domain-containing protein [Candidatus Neptunochlamydia vexilliferae]|uniref:DUF1207 domain-containing protein n=1 Tax=Candidatus Neptunichlamydia vexilliferae TaxID=1651774 RepID=UPI001891C139|nr:DUF1207 domain-containing protein [Candidatus Neptunochlamydia vexilliferae]
MTSEDDAYLEGYIQALVNSHYYEFDVLVYVENGDVYLYNLPKNDLTRDSIISFVSDVPGVISVTPVEKFPEEKLAKLEERETRPQINGIWFPQQTVLYPPMIANPMATIYSAAYRIGDNVVGTKSIAVSYGDEFPIFRWRDVFRWNGAMQIGIQAGVWSVFKMGVHHDNGEISELFNTDYLVGFPLTYAANKWAFRLRVYHISSHLGDEFIVHHPEVKRVNPSMEALDLFVSWQVNKALRVYVGPGWVWHSDSTYPIKPPLYVEWGGEVRLLGQKFFYHRLYGTAFLAVYLRNWQVNGWNLDGTYMAGYEVSKLEGVGRKIRLFVNYHRGYSVGQFFKDRTSFTGFGFSWGF